jgi:hypothetical protein
MPRRTSVQDFVEIDYSANEFTKRIQDKRNAKRADAKRNRRNRHYASLLLKQQLNKGMGE